MRVEVLGIIALLLIASGSCASFKSLKPMKSMRPQHKLFHKVLCSEVPVAICPGRHQWRRLDCGRWTKDCLDLINPELKCPARWKWSNIDGYGWTKVCFKSFDLGVEQFCPGRFTWARMDNWQWVKDCLGVWNNEEECPGRFRYINSGLQVGWTKECLRVAPQWYFGWCPTRIRWDRLDNGWWLRQCVQSESTRAGCTGRWRWRWAITGWTQSCIAYPIGWRAPKYNWILNWQLPFGTQTPVSIPQATPTENLIFGLRTFLKKGKKLILQVAPNGAISIRLNPDQGKEVPDVLIKPAGKVTAAQQIAIDQLEDELNASTDLDGYSIRSDTSLTVAWGPFDNLAWFRQLQALYAQKKSVGIDILKNGEIQVKEDASGEAKTYIINYDTEDDDDDAVYEAIQEFLKKQRLDSTDRFGIATNPKAQWYLDLLRLLKAGKQAEIDIDETGKVIVREAKAQAGGNPWFFSNSLLRLTEDNDGVRWRMYEKIQAFLLGQEELQKYTTTKVVTTIEKPISSQTLGEQKWLDSLEKKVKEAKDVFVIIDEKAQVTLREDPNDNQDGVGTITLVFTTADRSEAQIASYQRIHRLLNTRPQLKPSVFESKTVFVKKDTVTVTVPETATVQRN